MKKFLLTLAILILIFVLAFALLWINKPNIFAHYISKELNVPVSIDRVGYSPGHWSMKNLDISNPKGSKNKTAFLAKKTDIDVQLSQLFGDKMIIDKIELSDITLGIELYNKNGTDNNWARIIDGSRSDSQKAKKTNGSQKKKSKGYLIKKLIFRNITVILTDSTGKTTTLGPIRKLEFDNISDETGLPIDEIEKVIINLVIKSIIKQFNLQNLLKMVDPTKLIKVDKIIPKIFLFSSPAANE